MRPGRPSSSPLFLALLLMALSASQSLPSPGETVIHSWQGGAQAAVSVTMDDGYANHWRYMAPLLSSRGLRGTFYVVPGWLDAEDLWSPWQSVADAGHEIDSHTFSHISLIGLDPRELADELRRSRRRIQKKLGLHHGRTLAYPFSKTSPQVAQAAAYAGYEAARTGGDRSNPDTPEDLFLVHSRHPLADTPLDEMVAWLDQVLAEGGWLVVGVHGIRDPDHRYPRTQEGWQPVPLPRYEAFIEHLAADPRLWVAPFGEIARYIKGRDRTASRLLEVSSGRIRVELTGSTGSAPLSIETEVPPEWTGVRLELPTGNTRTYPTAVSDGRRRVVYEVVPPTLVTLRPSGVAQESVLTRAKKRQPPPGR